MGGQKLEQVLKTQHISSISASHPLVQPPSANQCQRRSVKCSFLCVPTSQISSQCLCPSGSVLDRDNSTCVHQHLNNSVISAPRKTVNIDQHINELKRSEEKDNFIIVLLVGTIAGSLLLILVVRRFMSSYYTINTFVILRSVLLCLNAKEPTPETV